MMENRDIEAVADAVLAHMMDIVGRDAGEIEGAIGAVGIAWVAGASAMADAIKGGGMTRDEVAGSLDEALPVCLQVAMGGCGSVELCGVRACEA